MADNYSNETLGKMLENLERQLHEIKSEHLQPIKEQVTKTNGRVSSLEGFRWQAKGAIGIITLLVLPMAWWFARNYLIK